MERALPVAALAASPPTAPALDLQDAYALGRRLAYAAAAVAGAVLLAGFWNFQLVDGFGRDVIAGGMIGDPAAVSAAFPERGFGFGFLFAAAAGLAATFTACNCVVFAMLPGLACDRSAADTRRSALNALAIFTIAVVGVSALYGAYIGLVGSEGIEAYNRRDVRMTQANAVFTAIGLVMLGWGTYELRLFGGGRESSVRALLARPVTKAAIMGVLVGAFAIGRPFPVMREFLVYAAAANSPLYGAGVMIVQGLGQIALMVGLFLLLVYALRPQLVRWVTARPQQVALTQALALVAGGAFFVFYWGLALTFDIGRWGFKLGWY